MGSSMLGSVLQLPGVGGGSQLATIAALEHIFDVPRELAASCGIMLWLTTFVAVIPAGLLLAHHERLSLRKLSRRVSRKRLANRSPRATGGLMLCSFHDEPDPTAAGLHFSRLRRYASFRLAVVLRLLQCKRSVIPCDMKCPFCGFENDKVVDSRESKEADSIRRRRECLKCGKRFTTYERIDEIPYMVVKKDGRREKFDRQKSAEWAAAGLRKAPRTHQPAGTDCERGGSLCHRFGGAGAQDQRGGRADHEPAAPLRKWRMCALPVYLDFKDVQEFMTELKDLLKTKEPPEVSKGAAKS